jgi:hypothetical protein
MDDGVIEPPSHPPVVAMREGKGVTVVCVTGRLAQDAVVAVRSACDQSRRPVVVDCIAVDGIEAPALDALRELTRDRDDVVLRRVPAVLRAALQAQALDGLVAYAER